MKRVALLLLLSFAPFARPALAELPPKRSHPARRHHTAASLGLVATLLLMPWSALALARSARRDKAHKPHTSPPAPRSFVSARAVNVSPPATVNPPTQPAPVVAPTAPPSNGPSVVPSTVPTAAPVEPTPSH